MATSIVVLTEQALSPADAGRLVRLHADEQPSYRVLVPADTHRSLLVDVLDHLSLLELREAVQTALGHDDQDRATAEQALAASVTAVSELGVPVEGAVLTADPIAALAALLAADPADEVVVVTRPHAIEDTLHTDWASRARERLGLPVLHLYAGSSWIG